MRKPPAKIFCKKCDREVAHYRSFGKNTIYTCVVCRSVNECLDPEERQGAPA